MTALEAIPAMDLAAGRVVRLLRGERREETVYGADPVRTAVGFAEAGATRLHVVDLDAAFGDGDNRRIVREVLRRAPLRIQAAGGVRTVADFEELLEAGASRVVFGTAAVEQPEVVEEAIRRDPARVAVALDVRDGRLRTRGWVAAAAPPTSSPGSPPGAFPDGLDDAARRWGRAGVGALVVTGIERDGTMAGPDIEAAARAATLSGRPTIVAGGVGSVDHLLAVRAAAEETGAPLSGVILGRALYERRFTLSEARAALAPPR